MEQLLLTGCVVAGILFGVFVARYLSKGAVAAVEAKAKADAQHEVVALGERLASKESRLVEMTREAMEQKRRLEDALTHASRMNGAHQQFEAQLLEMRRQGDEKLAVLEQSHQRALESVRTAHAEKVAQAEKRMAQLAESEKASREAVEALRAEVAALKLARADAEGQQKMVDEAQARLTHTLRAMSAEAFQQNNRAFMDLARAAFDRFQEAPRPESGVKQSAIDEAVRPLRDALARVAGAIAGMERDRTAALAGLSEQVEVLLSTQQQMREETQCLVTALKGSAASGGWGEVQLRRVVEMAGMLEHCDFEPANSPAALLVHLPNQRVIAVDASLPLDAYCGAMDATADAVRQERLREHAAAARQHVACLASEEYWNLLGCQPELVVAFLPGEALFSAALGNDPGLLEFGASQRVVLAGPAALIALLKAAAYGWQHQRLTEDARQISSLGQSLYDSLRDYQTCMDEVRGNLERTVESYNRAAESLESGVLPPVRQLRIERRIESEPIAIPSSARLRPRAVLPLPAVEIPAPVERAEPAPEPIAPVADPELIIPPDPVPAVAEQAALEFTEMDFGSAFEPQPEPVIAQEPEAAAVPEPEPVIAQESVAAATPTPEPEPVAVVPEPVAVVPEPVAAIPEPEPVAVTEPEPPAAEIVAAPEAEPAAVSEFEIDDPEFPTFAPELKSMAVSVGPSAPAPPSAEAVERSGFFPSYIKI